jgi:hypothetical protein
VGAIPPKAFTARGMDTVAITTVHDPQIMPEPHPLSSSVAPETGPHFSSCTAPTQLTGACHVSLTLSRAPATSICTHHGDFSHQSED